MRTLWTALLIFTLASLLFGQRPQKPRAEVSNVQLTRSVLIEVTMFAADKILFVPFCGESDAGTKSLCYGPARVEVQKRGNWRPVELRHRDAILGALAPDRRKAEKIEAGGRGRFILAISKDDFAVETGQRLRLVVDAWPNEQSARNGGQPIQMVTPSFGCP